MTDLMRRFAEEYVVDCHGEHAAIRAGGAPNSARTQASRWLANADVQSLIATLRATISKNTGITAERALEEAWGIVTADVNELVEYRRTCCRHCYGIDYGWQRTSQEMSHDQRFYLDTKRKAIIADANCESTYEAFDEKGGIGYDKRKPPVSSCTNCWGDGVGEAHFKPTASLSPAARALYAGVKQTKDGFQMLLIDKNSAMEKIFKHLGLYRADNKQRADALGEFLNAVQQRNGKLPIKG